MFNQPLERETWCTIINGYFSIVCDFSFQKVLTLDTKNLKTLLDVRVISVFKKYLEKESENHGRSMYNIPCHLKSFHLELPNY